MAKIYLIDSENVGDTWIQLLSSMTDEDKLYVFYTDKSPYISYESLLQVIAYGSIPVFIKCYEGRNALDFQLVSELGFQLAQLPEEEFIIVSDDNGYDAVVRFWSEKQYKIRRIGRKFCRLLPAEKKDVQSNEKLKEEIPKEPFVETTVPEMNVSEAVSEEESHTSLPELIYHIVCECDVPDPQKDAKCVYEMFSSLSMATLTEVNTALKILIGNEEGNNIYRELKEHQECRQALDDLYLPTQKERFFNYVGMVLDRSDLQDLTSEELAKFLLRIPRKNLNSIRASMQKEFGAEQGSKIYTVYKPHIKVLNKI